jgi:hypothetical protein
MGSGQEVFEGEVRRCEFVIAYVVSDCDESCSAPIFYSQSDRATKRSLPVGILWRSDAAIYRAAFSAKSPAQSSKSGIIASIQKCQAAG